MNGSHPGPLHGIRKQMNQRIGIMFAPCNANRNIILQVKPRQPRIAGKSHQLVKHRNALAQQQCLQDTVPIGQILGHYGDLPGLKLQ